MRNIRSLAQFEVALNSGAEFYIEERGVKLPLHVVTALNFTVAFLCATIREGRVFYSPGE